LFTSRRNSTSDDSDSFGSSNCSGALDFFGTGGLSLSSHEAEEALLFVPGLIDLFDTRGLLLNLLEAEEAFLSLPCSLGSGVEADLGKQPLLSFLGSGDDVSSDGLRLCAGTSCFPYITSLKRSTNALAE